MSIPASHRVCHLVSTVSYLFSNGRHPMTIHVRTFTLVGSTTTPDMTSLTTFGRKPQRKKPSKMPPQTASGGISRERFKRGSPNSTWLSETTGHTNLPDMTSLVTSSRQQNAIKYCTQVMGKTGPAGQRAKYFGHRLTQTNHRLHGHPGRPTLRPHRI